MADSDIPRPHERPGTGAEDIPPGATRRAWERPSNPPGGPGSSAGPRHMAGDPGDGNELTDETDLHREPDPALAGGEDEQGTAYSGFHGGAVGGTPAGGRSTGGNIHGGIAPGGVHRGDSTVGARPDAGKKPRKSRKKK